MLSLLDGANLSQKEIRKLAFQTGFCKRSSGKIDASDFLLQLCLQSLEGTVSYNDLAARIEVKTGTSASRQAYWERTNDSCIHFFQRILDSEVVPEKIMEEIPIAMRQYDNECISLIL